MSEQLGEGEEEGGFWRYVSGKEVGAGGDQSRKSARGGGGHS